MSNTISSPAIIRRPRPVVSCLACRTRKLKCNRCYPCDRCVRGGRSTSCRYALGQEPQPEPNESEGRATKRPRAQSPTLDTFTPEILEKFNDLEARMQQIEGVLVTHPGQSERPVQPKTTESTSHSGSIIDEEIAVDLTIVKHQINALDTYTGRLFGTARDFIDCLGQPALPDDLSEMEEVAKHLRKLSHELDNNRLTEHFFHIHDTTNSVVLHMETMLPPANACRFLIKQYFDFFEDCNRILHRGTTRARFEAYFRNPRIADYLHTVPQLLAVVSIASSLGIFPEYHFPSLHGEVDGIGAYQLIRNYLNVLKTNQWLETDNIQVALLTLKFHKSCPLNELDAWLWAGQLSRRVMASELYLRGASPDRDFFNSEIRKRLRQTILELELTLSVVSGMPYSSVLWSGTPPCHVDDDELYAGMTSATNDKDTERWTNGLCQHILAKSFNARVAAYNAVSSSVVAPYSDILGHTRHIEQVIHDLPSVFRLGPGADEAADTPYRLMAKMEVDFLLRRPLNACYAPYAKAMPSDDRFEKARVPWIQGCTIGICFQDLFDPQYPMIDLPEPRGLWDYFYNVYSYDAHQFMLASCLELQRLQAINAMHPDMSTPIFQGHTLRTPLKVMGWSQESMVKSLEDTIEPMFRRIGRHGSSMRSVVQWTTVIGSLRIGTTRSKLISIKNELQRLLTSLHCRFSTGNETRLSNSEPDFAESVKTDLLWLQRYLQQTHVGLVSIDKRTDAQDAAEREGSGISGQ